jgi:signal transduction histidine kinase
MRRWISSVWTRLTWAQRFLLASLVILVTGMAGIGAWVGQQIEMEVIHQTAAYTALYVSSVVEPNLQELADGDTITPEHQAMLDRLLNETSQGQHITAIKVWNKAGRVVYATDKANLGLTFPIDGELARALRGWVAADISNLDKPENAYDADRGQRRLETYTPVRHTGTSQIIAAIEYYQTVDDLDRAITSSQQRSWLLVAAVTVSMYLLLAGFVRRLSDTIQRQQGELSTQVARLREVLTQNQELHERVQRAAQRTTALNERFLRRISAELHDGPAQDLGLALLRLDNLEPAAFATPAVQPPSPPADFQLVQGALQNALKEIRAISGGMGLPELENVSLTETVTRAVRAHERRTGTPVALTINALPEGVALPVKITVYRLIQEALSNAYRHAGAVGQQIRVEAAAEQLQLVISDDGPGFDTTLKLETDEHLGLVGMRERVESLGGTFRVESAPGRGARVVARLPLAETLKGESV